MQIENKKKLAGETSKLIPRLFSSETADYSRGFCVDCVRYCDSAVRAASADSGQCCVKFVYLSGRRAEEDSGVAPHNGRQPANCALVTLRTWMEGKMAQSIHQL